MMENFKTLSIDKQIGIVSRESEEIISIEDLEKKLYKSKETGQPLKIKYGADPSTPDLHLGHSVPLMKLRDIQDIGHEIYYLIGDFTGRIGDPAGSSRTRNLLTREEIEMNIKSYHEQAFKILDRQKTKVVYNSEWLEKLSFWNFLYDIATKVTVPHVLERKDFKERLDSGLPFTVIEFLYPLIQAYDSVAINADVEIGGTDQRFNLLLGRKMQEAFGQSPQVALILPLLIGTDGRKKMSKSLGNSINLSDEPKDMYGKIMSISDEMMLDYYRLLTKIDKNEYGALIKTDPMSAKRRLAKLIVAYYHDLETAEGCEHNFYRMFREKRAPSDAPSLNLTYLFPEQEEIDIIDLLSHTGDRSRSEYRRLINQGAVSFNGEKITDVHYKMKVDEEGELRVGRNYFRLTATGD